MAVELESFLEQRGKKEQLDEIRKITKLINVAYVRQGEPLGLGHAVLVAKNLVGDEPFAVMLGDDVIDATPPALRQMIDVFERVNGPVLAVERVPPEDVSSYGIVAIDDSAISAPASIASPTSSRSRRAKRRLRTWRSSAATSSRPTSSRRCEATARDRTGEIQLTNGLRQSAREAADLRVRDRRGAARHRQQARIPEGDWCTSRSSGPNSRSRSAAISRCSTQDRRRTDAADAAWREIRWSDVTPASWQARACRVLRRSSVSLRALGLRRLQADRRFARRLAAELSLSARSR